MPARDRVIVAGLALVVLAAAPLWGATSHDATSHRRFDDPSYWTTVFDDPARAAWQKPDQLVSALGLRPGQCVADLGAGTGYFSRLLSSAVGPSGTVLAVDPEPNLIVYLRQRSEREGTANVVPVLASNDNPRLPAGLVDVVLIVDTYHHIDDRIAYLRNLRRALRPSGRVAVVDWQKRPMPVGPEMDHKLAREQVVGEMTAAGYRLVEEPTFLPYQYFLIFTQR
jgi:ubiquinone/menaquinone biosynthesis C-methylase UbiE